MSGQDGFLARDLNANGLIDNGGELFGTPTLNGFEALKALDSNADGNITAADAAFSSLRIWKDANHNGITDVGELTTLDANNITSIDVVVHYAATSSGEVNASGLSSIGSGTKSDRSTIEVGNYNVMVDQRNGAYTKDYDLDLRTLFLPTLKGHGNAVSKIVSNIVCFLF